MSDTINLMHGDCLDRLKELPDGSIDLTVTSPPYDNLRTYNGYTFDFEGIAAELYRVTADGGVVVWVVGDATIKGSETGTSFRQALHFKDVCGFNLHDTMIWHKGKFSNPCPVRYHQVFEYMFVLSKGRPKSFQPIEDRRNKAPGRVGGVSGRRADGSLTKRNPKTSGEFGKRFAVWTVCPQQGVQHPAPFPEALARDHILSWSSEGDTVLDPFLGSGTTGKMAMLLNRKFIGIEISDEYLKIAKDRIEKARADAESDLLAVVT